MWHNLQSPHCLLPQDEASSQVDALGLPFCSKNSHPFSPCLPCKLLFPWGLPDGRQLNGLFVAVWNIPRVGSLGCNGRYEIGKSVGGPFPFPASQCQEITAGPFLPPVLPPAASDKGIFDIQGLYPWLMAVDILDFQGSHGSRSLASVTSSYPSGTKKRL